MTETLLDILTESVLITGTVLLLMMFIEYIHIRTRGKWIQLMDKKPHVQILLCALLGLTPGCVGVFAVVSMFTHNVVGFGALLAACIASFGDEAFFLLSIQPLQAGYIGGILFVTSLLAGFGYNRIRPFQSTTDIHQMEHLILHDSCTHAHGDAQTHHHDVLYRILLAGAIALFITGLCTGILGEHEEGESGLSGENLVFVIIAGLGLLMACLCSTHFIKEHLWNHILKKHLLKIFLWTFGVLLLLALLARFVDLNALQAQEKGKFLLLAIALAIGLIPQSGPHLAVIYLFMDGIVPFSTLLANCLLQEGHGGIPLLAESPKSFVRLKILKGILALAVGTLGIVTGF